jgi:hypothetical protein
MMPAGVELGFIPPKPEPDQPRIEHSAHGQENHTHCIFRDLPNALDATRKKARE